MSGMIESVYRGIIVLRKAIGIDLGGTFIKAALVDQEGAILYKEEAPTLAERGPDDILLRIEQMIRDIAAKHALQISDLSGLGIAIPGFIDDATGVADEVVNIGWRNVAVREPLHARLGIHVAMENDANAAALGEAWAGAGRGRRFALCVTLGTGVGGGVVIDGKVLRGANTMAGEIGHMVMVPGGAPCNCGHHGCLETISSATGVVRLAREGLARAQAAGESSALAAVQDLTAAAVFAAAEAGDVLANAVVDEAIETLAWGLGTAANVVNPEVIVVGGGMSRAGERLFAPLREAFPRYALRRVALAATIVPATLGNDAGVVGAARLAL